VSGSGLQEVQVRIRWRPEECSGLLRRGLGSFLCTRAPSPVEQVIDVTLELVECAQACRHCTCRGAVRRTVEQSILRRLGQFRLDCVALAPGRSERELPAGQVLALIVHVNPEILREAMDRAA